MRRIRRTLITFVLTVAFLVGAAQLPASAAWRTVHQWPGGSVFLACRYNDTGPYGPVWRVRLVLAHHPNEAAVHLRGTFRVMRKQPNGSYATFASTRLATDRVGQWDVDLATGSQLGVKIGGVWYPDRWSWGISDERGGLGDLDPQRFTTIGSC